MVRELKLSAAGSGDGAIKGLEAELVVYYFSTDIEENNPARSKLEYNMHKCWSPKLKPDRLL